MASVESLEDQGANRVFRLKSSIADQFRVDESVCHNGVCLTVEEASGESYRVTAIDETLQRSNLGDVRSGDLVNLERSMPVGGRLDGHFVQGHVDAKGTVERIEDRDGSWEVFLSYPAEFETLIVEKGSVCLNGISLTIASSAPAAHQLSVAIIPHTWNNTNIARWRVGGHVNIEFDVLGKYVQKIMQVREAQV